MKRRISYLLMLTLFGLSSCFQGDNATTTDDANDAAGTGDPDLAREVTGMWLLSTDYNYDERCNYLSEEFVRTLFKLGESPKLVKYDMPNGCEVRWDGQKVGFYFDEGSPYESTFQSEYAFDKRYQPKRVDSLDKAMNPTPGEKSASADLKNSTYHGPQQEGTGAERPANGFTGSNSDSSPLNDTSKHPSPGITSAATQLATPAKNIPTGVVVNGVGDKAIWEPGKKTLHVLHLNHVLNVTAQMKGDDKTLREGTSGLAKVIISRLFDPKA